MTIIDLSYISAKYCPPLVDILLYNGVMSIVAIGAREAAVLELSLGVFV